MVVCALWRARKKTNEASSSRRRGGLEKTAGPSPAVRKQQGPFPRQGQQACTHTHACLRTHTEKQSGGKSRAFKINNAMRHEHAGYHNSGRRLPPRVQPNRAEGMGNQPSLLRVTSPPLPVSWRGWVRGWGGPDNHASSRGPCRLLAAGRALHRRYCLYWGAGDGRGANNPQRPSEREREPFPRHTTTRREDREETQRRCARACTHPSPTWKWPTLLHLYTPRHACSIYIYIMYIRMLYYYAMLTSHCNILKRERGGGRGKGISPREGKKRTTVKPGYNTRTRSHTHLAQHPQRILL